MDLGTYVESIRRDLSAAAEVAGEDARAAADRMTAALESGVRLALLDALSDASAEITRDLAPGSVEVRLRGRDPEFVVTAPPDETDADAEADLSAPYDPPRPPTPPVPPNPPGAASESSDEDVITRLTLRMPEALKNRVEEAADAEHLSVNQWLVRTIGAALSGAYGEGRSDADYSAQPGTRTGRAGRDGGGRAGRGYRGWVR